MSKINKGRRVKVVKTNLTQLVLTVGKKKLSSVPNCVEVTGHFRRRMKE